MAISAISGFSPALSLIGSLSPLGRVSPLSPSSGLNSLFALASTQTSISDLGRLLNRIEALQDAAAALSVPGVFVARTASVSGTPIATASVGAATSTGSFALQVDRLAQAQTLTSAALASSLSTIGSGAATTLTFQFAGGGSRSVTLGAAGDTLAGIAAAIDAADIGIDATLRSSASGVQLTLTGQTGAGNAFTVAVDGDAAIADLLAFPAGGSGGPTLTASAQDAAGEVDGIAFSASTNTVATALPGLTLNLLGSGSATLTVAANSGATATAVRGFVDAFNEVQRGFAGLAGGSPLLGLSSTLFSSQLSATLAAGGNAPSALAQVGITSRLDGTLGFNETVFQTALAADPQRVAAVFSNGGRGLAEQVAAQAAGPLSPEQLLPALAPALSFSGAFGATSADSLLVSFFAPGGTGTDSLSSSLANQLLFAELLGAGRAGGTQTTTSLVDLMLAEVLFANAA